MNDRYKFATKMVADAMHKLSVKHPDIPFEKRPSHAICIVDWSIDSWDAREQWKKLEAAIDRYAEKKEVGIDELRTEYKKYAAICTRWYQGEVEMRSPPPAREKRAPRPYQTRRSATR